MEVNEIKEACKRMKNHAASGCNKSFFSFLLPVVPNIFFVKLFKYILKKEQKLSNSNGLNYAKPFSFTKIIEKHFFIKLFVK